jgi:hypothetical protein
MKEGQPRSHSRLMENCQRGMKKSGVDYRRNEPTIIQPQVPIEHLPIASDRPAPDALRRSP